MHCCPMRLRSFACRRENDTILPHTSFTPTKRRWFVCCLTCRGRCAVLQIVWLRCSSTFFLLFLMAAGACGNAQLYHIIPHSHAPPPHV